MSAPQKKKKQPVPQAKWLPGNNTELLDVTQCREGTQPLVGMKVVPCPECGKNALLANKHLDKEDLYIHSGRLKEGAVEVKQSHRVPLKPSQRPLRTLSM